jgi:hypothetical protein
MLSKALLPTPHENFT